ncbi:MAG: VCBS repeat-containing protein [bacterium]|nr:VCBS repeat-containing protein [bacterium]
MNLDGIPDIIYTINNRIEIVFGDYRSEFKNKISLKIEGEPASVQIGDFNSDKVPDIAYLILNNSLNIIFGKDGQQFYESVPYLKNASIISFTRSRFASAFELACLTSSGELTLLSSRIFNPSDIKISLGVSAGAVTKFDYDNDGNDDIAFVDENDRSLKLLVNNNSGIPSKYYSIPLAEAHTEIKVDEFFKFRKIFYCYSEDAPLLEVFRYNFNTDKISRKQLYAPGEILDVYFQRIDSSFVNIFVLYNKKSKMYLGKFENKDVSITFKEYPVIDRNVTEAELFVMDEPVIYYWKSENNTFEFKTVRIKTGPNVEKTNLRVSNSIDTKVNLYGADQFDNEYPFVASLVQSEMENYLVVVSADKISISKKINESIGNEKPEFGKAFFGETSIKGINNFTVNSINDNYIYKLVYRQTDNTYLLNQMFPAENVSDYLFARLNKKNYFLVYSNKEENCISIRSLKK